MSAQRLALAMARIGVGPMAIGAFFADWVAGTGLLAGRSFSGFDLVAVTGNLQGLDLGPAETAALATARVAILAVIVAGAWQTVLAPWPGGHPAYRLSGWYIALAAAFLLAASVAGRGLVLPYTGPILLAGAAFLFVVSRLAASPARPRWR